MICVKDRGRSTMTVEELSAKAIRSTNYAAATTVSIQETIHDIGKIVTQNSGTIEACKETSYGSLIHFKINRISVRFSIRYPSHFEFKNLSRWEQAKKSIWRALYLTIKAKFISVQSGIESVEEAFMAQIVQADGQVAATRFLPLILDGAGITTTSADMKQSQTKS